MAQFQLPLTNIPQNFQISLAGKEYLMTCKWNASPEAGWVLDFADALTGAAIAANIAVVTGTNLLAGLEYLGFGGALYVFTDGDQLAVPTLDNLGTESNVYFVTED